MYVENEGAKKYTELLVAELSRNKVGTSSYPKGSATTENTHRMRTNLVICL